MENCRRRLLGLLGGSFAAAALPALAQQSKLPRIGFLAMEGLRPRLEVFRQGLRDAGYVEGKNVVIDVRFAPAANPEKLDVLAAELVAARVDVIIAPTNNEIAAVKRATSTVPIVMVVSGEPVGQGFVKSLARPGGNITGQAWSFHPEMMSKHIEVLAEMLPGLQRVGALIDVGFPITYPYWKAAERAAATRSLHTKAYEIRSPSDLRGAFDAMKADRVSGLLVFAGPLILSELRQIANLGIQHRIALMFSAHGEGVDVGGLASYGPDVPTFYRRSAIYVDKILRGAKPADLPVEQPVTVKLRINLKTAKAIGIVIPRAVLVRADEVIE